MYGYQASRRGGFPMKRSSSLLIEDYPIIVSPKLAALIGLKEAIILQQIQDWLIENGKHNRNFHDGRYWTVNTIEQWCEAFPFWSKNTVERTLKSLRDKGLVITGNYNRLKFDRTLWYTINYDEIENLKAHHPNLGTTLLIY